MVRASSQGIGDGSSGKVALGKYHMIVNEAKADVYNGEEVGFDLTVEILGGTVADQENKVMKFQTFRADWDSFWDLVAALGLTDKVSGEAFTMARLQAHREAKKAGKAVDFDCDFDPEECVGRQFFADVVTEKKKDGTVKAFPRIGREIYSVTDDRAKDIPRNQDMIDELLGITAGSRESGGGSARD